MPDDLGAALAEVRSLLLDADRLIRAVAAGRRRGAITSIARAELRPVDLKSGRHLQLIASDGQRPTTQNLPFGPAAESLVDDLLAEPFGNWHVETTEVTLQLRVTKRGDAQVHRSAPVEGISTEHDRAKLHLLAPDDPLFAVVGGTAAKRRQVDAFLRSLAAALEDYRGPLRVVDLGCGNVIAMCPGVEMVRFACSGTEATMHALRVARAYTGREKVIKFEGMYHGFQDYTLFSTYAPPEAYGNINHPIPIPSSSGIPRVLSDLIITLPFNNKEVFEKALTRYGHEVAAVISEPCMGNCGAILPEDGFLAFIAEKCAEQGILFILDEVKTGFRIAKGGAQEVYGLKPDLATYAKSLGNGYPIAAFGGKREIMGIIGQGVAQGGTFNNNKPGVAGAYATLRLLNEEPVFETIEKRGKRLMDGICQIFRDAGIQAYVTGYPAMFSFGVGVPRVSGQRDWNDTNKGYYLRLVEALLERGVMPDHDPREPWFLSYSHSDADIDETLNRMDDAVQATVHSI